MSSRLTVHVRPLPNLVTFPSRTAAGVPGGRLAETSTESAVGKFIAPPISAGLTALVTWLSAGATGAVSQAVASLLALLGGICGLSLTLYYRRQLGVLGSSRKVAAERRAYEALRNSLAEGNLAARLYAEGLTRFLDWVDRFFRDTGMADRTLFPHAFWLRTPAPLWTAPALDRCLLLALFYPILIIFVIWAISGHVGPAESSLRLNPNVPAWQRAAAAVAVGCLLLLPWRPRRRSWKPFLWELLVFVTAFAAAYASGAGVIVNAAAVLTNIVLGRFNATSSGTFAVFSAIFMCLTLGLIGFHAGGIVLSLGLLAALCLAFLALATMGEISLKRGLAGVFMFTSFAVMILACLGSARLLPTLNTWEISGPMVLFLGLLTLLNAPFDWFSLGLTRALLRRGLELGGWWPYGLALVDAALAAVIIAVLALTMVVGVQAFDALAVHGGGASVLPLEPLFNGIAAHPTAPEYWWLYALLLSTMIPSLVNLVIGGASLLRGLPGLPSLLLRAIPARGGVLKWDRHWIAAVLTAQVGAGAALGIAAQAFLVVFIIGYVMPLFGLELLDMARDLAAFNLPARVGQLSGASL
jgi:hypothetical protein